MSWFADYHSKIISADRAIQIIQPGMRVFMTGNCSVPQVLIGELTKQAPRLTEPVEVVQVLTIGKADYVQPGLEKYLRVNTLFISDNVREAVNDGRADFTPCKLSEIPLLFANGPLPLDVAMISVSPPDEHGFCSLGVEVGITKNAATNSKVVIAEVNLQMPRTLGDSFIHISRITHVVPVDYPLPEVRMGAPTELSKEIGRHVAAMIEDGSTLQMGIGAIPDGVLYFLKDKKNLGIHSELFSDGIIDLYEMGVINNERKTLHRGKIVAGFLLGTKRLYDFVDNNPVVELHPTEYVNDPHVIRQNDKMVAINSAIEVDLTGQVCADSIGPRLYSGVGGQLDFVRGAALSKGGKPVIALPSSGTNRSGERFSRVVPMLKEGAGVVTTRNDVRFIATEFGVADVWGKTIRQRARALIDVSHPDFREELERKGRELKYL
jgi:acetyl-CoA hydrolase